MTSSRKNNTIFIDKEAAFALELVKANLLFPVTSLMGKAEAEEVLHSGLVNGKSFPFPFILSPSGKRNEKVIKSLKPSEEITILCDNKEFARLVVDEVFEINPKDRVKHIYGTDDIAHPGVNKTIKRIGSWAISGNFELLNPSSITNVETIKKAKELTDAKEITALFLAANPLHRAHERLIRQALNSADLLVLFLQKPYDNSDLRYDLRKKSLDYFVKNFLPKNRVVIVPIENNYIFAGYNELIINSIVAKNHGCSKLIIGSNHAGLGIFFDSNTHKSIVDRVVGIDIDIQIENEYVYCNECTTLVSKESCPHGQHHQISYHADSILELIKLGILPPTILMRKEISAFLLSNLFPNRFKNLEKLYYDLLPVEGILKEHTEQDFYLELIKLHQTTSLT
jgi:sulfate adenylyltransferase